MPRSGNGVYSLPNVYLAQPGTTIRSDQHNAPLEDLAQSMTNSLARDGQSPMLADLPMNGRRVTNMGEGVAQTDAARMSQLPPAMSQWLQSVSDKTFVANRIVYSTGANTSQLATLTAFGRSLIAAANAAAGRAALEIQEPTQNLYVEDRKSATTGGGDSVADTWVQRDLNTTPTTGISGASVASNNVILPAGTYEAIIAAPARGVGGHKARLFNVTSGNVIRNGTSEHSDGSMTASWVRAQFTLSETSTLRVEHFTRATVVDGFGSSVGLSGVEVYTTALFRKIG